MAKKKAKQVKDKIKALRKLLKDKGEHFCVNELDSIEAAIFPPGTPPQDPPGGGGQ